MSRQYRDVRRWVFGERRHKTHRCPLSLRCARGAHRVSGLLGGSGGVRWTDECYERRDGVFQGPPMSSEFEP